MIYTKRIRIAAREGQREGGVCGSSVSWNLAKTEMNKQTNAVEKAGG